MSTLFVCAALLLGADSSAGFEPGAPPSVLVEKAARDFRIQVYESFRRNRSEYDARRTMGDDMLQRWHDAGQPEDYHDVVVQWFEQAKMASRDASQTLPVQPVLPDRPVDKSLAGGDPTDAPHLPQLDRQVIDTGNPFADISGDGGDIDFLGQPKIKVSEPYEGPSWTPPSKILKSVQRALLISAGTSNRSANSPEDIDDASSADDSTSDDLGFPALNEPNNADN